MKVNAQQVHELLWNGTAGQRIAFVESLPPCSLKEVVVNIIGSSRPGVVVVALAPLITKYSYGLDPELGSVLASVTHERAVEIWENYADHDGLILSTLSGLAVAHIKALALLGESQDVLNFTDKYIKYYEQFGNEENLPKLRVFRIEAYVNLKLIDEAVREIQNHAELFEDPMVGIEAERLNGIIESITGKPTTLRTESSHKPAAPKFSSLVNILKTMVDKSVEGEKKEELLKGIDKLNPQNRVDYTDPEQFRRSLKLNDVLSHSITGESEDSETAMSRLVRDASGIFVYSTPDREMIGRSLESLTKALDWAKDHKVTQVQNDALWGIYLCYSRLNEPSKAADAALELRRSLESVRYGILDPMKRAGVFEMYPKLFNALCEKLYKSDRNRDLFEAIESSKGRVIADKLTALQQGSVADAGIYESVAGLPEIAFREKFHYVTFFSDDDCIYGVLVTKQGWIYAINPINIKKEELREISSSVEPKMWGRANQLYPGVIQPNVSEVMEPLAASLNMFVKDGVIEDGDHIVYSPDGEFYNIPLHIIQFGPGVVLDKFSVSRVHSAFHLDRLMENRGNKRPENFLGFIVPAAQDMLRDDKGKMVSDYEEPVRWLEASGLRGKCIRFGDATPQRFKEENLVNSIIHFSTHGFFPHNGNPYSDSFLLLAGEAGLPDREMAIREEKEYRLTPEDILNSNLNLKNSHVSMMACLSGLAKEGIGGDILGLDWALIQSGASSLISCHWEVSASCAASFFTSFYRKWIKEGQSRAGAWRTTMLELINGDYSKESLNKWSAFSLTGDFR